MIDLTKSDTKLYNLVHKEFGFSDENRIFHNALSKNTNEFAGSDNIGTVYLKDFIIYIGLIYDIFTSNEDLMMKSHLYNYQLNGN
jgi:hypothetical protein